MVFVQKHLWVSFIKTNCFFNPDMPVYHTFIFCALCFTSHSQKYKTHNGESYELEKTIHQHSKTFCFWRGAADTIRNKLLIERTGKNGSTVLFSGFIRDRWYSLSDINGDGFKDFIAIYHDYDVDRMFDAKTNLPNLSL